MQFAEREVDAHLQMRAAKVKWIMPAYEALRAMPGMYNQAIVTMYRDGTDGTTTIVPGSVVFDDSLGAERTFHGDDEPAAPR